MSTFPLEKTDNPEMAVHPEGVAGVDTVSELPEKAAEHE
jgi:hypothetical protein